MDSFDEDMFAFSDEEVSQLPLNCNPVEEHLMRQLCEVQERIEKLKNDIEEVQAIIKKVLRKLSFRAIYGESASSDSDSDLFTASGEPVLKKKKNRNHVKNQPLKVTSIWQRLIDGKWVIGVVLQNTSKRILYNPDYFVCLKNKQEFHGVSSFWKLNKDKLWNGTEVIDPNTNDTVATVIFDLPTFDQESVSEAFGTIVYEVGHKKLQTPVPNFRLSVQETIDGSRSLTYSTEVEYDILAAKAVSIEKTIDVQFLLKPEKSKRLLQFLRINGFKAIVSDRVFVVEKAESLRDCVLEILSLTSTREIRISARTMAQLNIILHLLRAEFPELTDIVHEDSLTEAAFALERELKLYLGDTDVPELQRARIMTDLLIP